MWRHNYNEDWERKKSYLIRSLFHDVPLLSPVPEESDDSSDAPRRPPSPIAYRPYSPLPPLTIEREPNRHDEPEEYYKVLEIKIKRIYRKLFIEGRELSDNDFINDSDVNLDNNDSNVINDLVNDNNHVTRNGHSAYYNSYVSAVPAHHVEHDESDDPSCHVGCNKSDDSSNDVNNDSADVTDENNNSKPRNVDSDSEIHEENCEMETGAIGDNDQEELAEEVFDTENTEDKSGSDYRQITTRAQIHVDGNQVETQSHIYEGSVRSVILKPRRLGPVEAGQEEESDKGDGEESEESMAEEESVTLEDNDDPGDVDMLHNESAAEDTDSEESHIIEDIEVMRTPQPKISVESVAHTALRQSDVTDEYNVTHHASLMTSDSDVSKPTSPVLNVTFIIEDDYSGTVHSGSKRKSGETTLDTGVLSHLSPILDAKSLSNNINVHTGRKRTEEEITSDMDITAPVSNINSIYLIEDVNIENVDTDRNIDLAEITSNTRVESHLNVISLNEDGGKRGRKRKAETPLLNEDAIMKVARDGERTLETLNLNESFCNEDEGRKRKGEDVGIQTVPERLGWEDLRTNMFVGAPKIFRLCSCSEHQCNISIT